jgi:hypothetical protein
LCLTKSIGSVPFFKVSDSCEIKRNIIIDREKKGSFIPICTRNVFLKYYSKNASQLYFWEQSDKEDYYNSIITVLNGYLPVQELEDTK